LVLATCTVFLDFLYPYLHNKKDAELFCVREIKDARKFNLEQVEHWESTKYKCSKISIF